MLDSLIIDRVLGDRSFAEIGFPSVAAVSESRGLVVAGGAVGPPGWQPGTLTSGRSTHRIGVYGMDGLRCQYLLPSRWPVNTIAFHPALPLAAIGTGSYDGGFVYKGELLLLDLLSGEAVSALVSGRDVRSARWRDERSLDLILAATDDESGEGDTWGFAASIARDDWAAPSAKTIGPDELAGDRVPSVRGGAPEAALRTLESLSATFTPRRQVRAVEPLRDGRVLAALDEVRLESWLPSGLREWVAPVPGGGGRRIVVTPDQRAAWVEIQWAPGWDGSRVRYRPNGAERLSLHNGEVLRPAGSQTPVVVTGRQDGWVLLLDTRHAPTEAATTLVSPDQQESEPLDLGGYEFANATFVIRRSPELLFLQPTPHGVWIAAVEPSGAVRPLFPLDWDAGRGTRLFGGPGVRLPDALVHAGVVSHSGPHRRIEAFVARRRADGEPEWVSECEAVVTAMDAAGDTVLVALDSGEVIALGAADGRLRWRRSLTVHGMPTSATSLAVSDDGRVLIGTADGRILDARY
ncbi:hypothetical protein E1293_07050 [Actinomadura darangshiensis]|uniref:Pyrrolo-quinoline quinone repeat domain-containing protein n=1 Tax=Actinomadura darangshiensis TaxID=705336 RepID=A0A4R5BME0_9ACTN|nr:PQQ-binding-like beta-propeller repeat protein [Actinomadura darangshiensis]TDD87968.1 hypothetical protein E1293_07050 [Actinomadura darangshiensis]